ncbi:unnamed protein product [Rotaria sordida]|uniref:Uncharacterized protein n=1 Tax=Rotaria sordida TaxID=392033 RepID=A0A819CWR7_9BILA|nr:unnamed protein product [Rotaria sordida]CAF1214598.1 unnamed protein product [Rotaria sordida]CAF3825272.1 unnamed protein product [Rotaria sordida]CAF3932903.1 unnamed protein product [Rotaria sordida]
MHQLKADLETVTFDTQLHQTVLFDVITTMKDFIQHFIPPSLTSSRVNRVSLISVAQQFYNRFQLASIRLNDGFQFNRKVSFMPPTVTYNITSNITVIINITGLSEPMCIIGIYWPTSQQRDLDDILPYLVEGTILTVDYNATVKEWNSPLTDNLNITNY